jgi:hypothetical protein
MSAQLLAVHALTVAVNLLATLFFAVRIAGVRTRRLGSAVALFNVLVLLMRLSTSFQALLLAKHIERNLNDGGDELTFRLLLFSATAGSTVGALLIPTGQRLITRAVAGLGVHRSLPRLLWYAVPAIRKEHFVDAMSWPRIDNVRRLFRTSGLPTRIVVLYGIANALLTVGLFSSLYAGYYAPEFRMTASNMSLLINGAATMIVLLFTDPFLGVITDDAIEGTMAEDQFRQTIVLFVIAHVIGTVGAQFLLLPGARLIAFVARSI